MTRYKWEHGGRRVGLSLAVALVVLMSGCTGFVGGDGGAGFSSGPSVSEPEAAVVDGTPAIVFNYSVSDFSDALVQGPSGEVIAQATIEPNQSVGVVPLYALSEGSYSIIIQQGGETVARKNVSFAGPSTRIESTTANWSGNSLESVTVTVTNSGDMPAKITGATVSARDKSASSRSTYWVPAGSSETITVSPTYEQLTITKPGDVRGSVLVNTSSGSAKGSFQHSFEPPRPKILNISTQWSGADLTRATATVTNAGDLPTEGNLSIHYGGEVYATTFSKPLPAGSERNFTVELSPILTQRSGGTAEVRFLLSTADGFDEKTITHTAEGANITLQEIQPVWQNGYLKNIVVTAQNTGDIDGTATVSATVEDTNFESEEFDVPSGQSVEYKYELGAGIYEDTSYAVRSGGDVQVDVTLEGPAGTDTATATKTFDGVEASLSGVELTSYAQYDSDKREVISVSFTVANRGDIPLSYDTVDITLGGSTQSYSPYSTTELKPGGSKTEFASIDGILVDSGSQELTIQFVREGEVVATATTTVTVG